MRKEPVARFRFVREDSGVWLARQKERGREVDERERDRERR